MGEIINILNTILRLIQILIILGATVIFIYLGILFYFKKYDEVKKNLPYVILGLALLISVYSIPVIILSFLERSPTGLTSISQDMSRNNNTTTNNTISNNITCRIEFIDYDDNFSILGNSPRGFNNPSVRAENNSCILNINFITQPERAYVLCQYGHDNREQDGCWGIYRDRYPDGIERPLDFSAFEPLDNLNPTRRIERFPSAHNTIYCTSTEITREITVPLSDKRYIFVIFSSKPYATNLCSGTTSPIVDIREIDPNLPSDLHWGQEGVDIFDLIATSTR